MTASRRSQQKIWILAVVVLALAVITIGVKHIILKLQWIDYAGKTQISLLTSGTKSAQEEGTIIAATSSWVVNGTPLYKWGSIFEKYIQNISKQTSRDIVILDKNKTILADTIPTNVGKKYTDDGGSEVSKTISDKSPRNFTEKSADYPNGISQTVVVMTDSAGTPVGAVIVSADKK